MLEVKPIQNRNEQEKACRACGVPFHEEYFTYGAVNDGALLAVAQCDILGKEAVFYTMKQVMGTKEDIEGLFILGRGILNFLELCAVETVIYDAKTPEEEHLARIVGFKKEKDGVFRLSLIGLFDAKCAHDKT